MDYETIGFKEYLEVINECFPEPPRNVPELLFKIMQRYPISFEYIYFNQAFVGGVAVVHLNNNIYGISCLVVKPSFQKLDMGKDLMNMVHEKYKGIFILKSSKVGGFYEKLGYSHIGNNIYVFNNEAMIDY